MITRLENSIAAYALFNCRSAMLSLALLMSFVSVVPVQATTSCDAGEVSSVFKGIDRQDLKVIQQDLRSIGYTALQVDGLLGPRTTGALVRFCQDLAVDAYPNLPEQEVTALTDYADIARTKLNWRDVVNNSDFARWLGTQTAQRQRHFKAIETAGGVLPITILADYTPESEPAPSPLHQQAPPQDDSAVYYRLSADDFAELQARGAILQQLETLKGVAYANGYALKKAAQESLAEITKLSDQYADIVLKSAVSRESYRLSDQSFDNLRIANVPEGALTPLQEIKNLAYPTKAQLTEAVNLRLQQATEAQSSQAPAEGANTEEQEATQDEAKTENPNATEVANASQPSMPVPVDYTKYAQQIDAQIEQIKVYQLTDQSFEELGKNPELQVIPAALLGMLDKLQDVEFVDRHQLVQAIHATLEIQTAYYQNTIVTAVGKALLIDPQTLENLTSKGVPDFILELIKPMQNTSYSDRSKLEKAVISALQKPQAGISEEALDMVLTQQAKRIAPEKLGTLAIRWNGDSCGCARVLSGVVYGFYPFWMVDPVDGSQEEDPAKTQQLLDFSMLTRVGYYGLYLDQQGTITQPRQWHNDKDNLGLVKTAEKYRTHLDLVVYTNAWQSWTEPEIDNAAKAVAEKMNLPLPLTSVSRLTSWLPFVDHTPATMGDGVTLYFDDFTNPAKAAARKNIVSFMQKLRTTLESNPRPLGLNMMIDIHWDEVAQNSEIFKELSKLLIAQGDAKPVIDLLLVFLEEPTTVTKKALRSKIENEFKGQNRKTVLRKIIPIVTPTGHDKEVIKPYAQFTDDLIYFEDNFAGLGLWPLPLAQAADTQKINDLIVDTFKPQVEEDFLERMAAEYLPQLCNYACPNRWQFRIGFDVLVVALIVLVLVSLSNCRLRQWLKRYPWPVVILVAALILVFATSLVCDPFWNQKSDDVTIALLGVIVVIGVIRYIRKLNQGALP